MTLGRDQAAALKTTTNIDTKLLAPLAAGAKVGTMTVATPDGTVVANLPIVALRAVPAGGLWTRMTDHISLWFK